MRTRSKWIDGDAAAGTSTSLIEKMGYIDADDVSTDVLGIDIKTGQNRRSTGDFPPVYKIGARKVCRVDEVDKWIRSRRVVRSA